MYSLSREQGSRTGSDPGQRRILILEYCVRGKARSQRAEDDTGGDWLTMQPEDGHGCAVDEDVRRDLYCLDELYNGIGQMPMYKCSRPQACAVRLGPFG